MNSLVWITGAGGLIGNQLAQTGALRVPEWKVRPLAHADLELTDSDAVRRAFLTDRPSLVIHCAAISRTDVCEREPELARKVNVAATQCLAEVCDRVPLIFLSSDLVFDGEKGRYVESDPTCPLSVYAETKLEAERIVLSNPSHTVVRISLNGGQSPRGTGAFNEAMRVAWQEGRTIKLFTDEFRSPLPAVVTAQAIWELAAQGASGLFHLAGSERLSRFEIGQCVAARWPQLSPKIEPGSLKDYRGARRPPDVSMDCRRVQSVLSFQLPGLRTWLAEHPEVVF